MRKMSIARQIKIQRLQNKNRMVGQTFNPSGITSMQIEQREREFVNEWIGKSIQERQEYWSKVSEIIKNRTGSWDWTWCAFQRNFIDFKGNVI